MHSKETGSLEKRSLAAMTACLLKSLPIVVTILFIVDTILMNFLARYTVVNLPWLAVNAAITISWISFLILDIVTKHFGPEAANILSVIAAIVNFTCSVVCAVICAIAKNPALDSVIGGQWSVFTASTIAFVASAISNNYLNAALAKPFENNPDGKLAYSVRSFVSTLISQFTDNFLFLFLAFYIFPYIPTALPVRWTMPQILVCSILCAILELVTEAVFAPFGYFVCKKWREKNVGKTYRKKYFSKELSHEA